MNAFLPADILFPQVDSMEQWAVIACDQFTSDPDYWERVRKNAEGAPSTINLILPEAELGTAREAEHTALINRTMAEYLKNGVFRHHEKRFRLCGADVGERRGSQGPCGHGGSGRL